MACGQAYIGVRIVPSSRMTKSTLGQDMIKKGAVSALLGIALVAVFMLFYYWYCGLVADIALFLNVVLLPATLVITANVFGSVSHDVTMGGAGSAAVSACSGSGSVSAGASPLPPGSSSEKTSLR